MKRYRAECVTARAEFSWKSADTFSPDFAYTMAEGHRHNTGHFTRVVEVPGA